MKPLPLILAISVLAPNNAPAQLPSVMVQPGTLRIEFAGLFAPADREYADGSLRKIGDPINRTIRDASSSPLVADMAGRIAALTGTPSSGGNIGAITADLSFQRAVGNIGLALGVLPKLTAFANIPIVSVRTEAVVEQSAEGATLGLNPAIAGSAATGAFIDSFTASIDALRVRIEAGEFLETPEIETAARDWFTESSLLRDELADLLLTEGRLSAVLPLAGTADAESILSTIAAAGQRFSTEFGVAAPTGAPAFPSTPVTDQGLLDLLESPDGFALIPFDAQPLVALGDVELGAAYQLRATGRPGAGSWSALWLLGGGTLATGTAPRQSVIRAQGTGDRQSDIFATVIAEFGRNSLGVRGELNYSVQQATDMLVRVGNVDEHLLPASRLAAVSWDPGDIFTLTARPFYRLANHLAIAGSISYFSRGADNWQYVDGATPASGGDPASMGEGTKQTLLQAGLGLSYSHDGVNRFGVPTMPVEAGMSISRSLSSSTGLVPAGTTTTVWFRVYKSIF